MHVIGVLDLRAGRAVRALGGRREAYRPAESAGGHVRPGDALELADDYSRRWGVEALYVADLDAILGRPPQDGLVARLADLGTPLWLDAAVSSVSRAREVLALGAQQVVVGLETLTSWDVLRQASEVLGANRIAFSLDLRNGAPVNASGATLTGAEAPHAVARRAARAGAGTVIVIDLARVGTRAGLDIDLLARIRAATPGLTLVAGGGVRGPEDLDQLASAGCDAALVATALQDGRLGPPPLARSRLRARTE